MPNFDPTSGEQLSPVGKNATLAEELAEQDDDDFGVIEGQAATGSIKVFMMEPAHGSTDPGSRTCGS